MSDKNVLSNTGKTKLIIFGILGIISLISFVILIVFIIRRYKDKSNEVIVNKTNEQMIKEVTENLKTIDNQV